MQKLSMQKYMRSINFTIIQHKVLPGHDNVAILNFSLMHDRTHSEAYSSKNGFQHIVLRLWSTVVLDALTDVDSGPLSG